MHLTKKLAIILCVLAAIISKAQKPLFEPIGTKEGLPDHIVSKVLQDSLGFLWLATSSGVYRYDGHQFYLVGNETDIKSLAFDGQHRFWGHDAASFFSIDTRSLQKKIVLQNHYEDANPNNDQFNNLYVDRKGRVWSCDYQFVKYYEPASHRLRSFKILPEMGYAKFAKFCEDSQGSLWMATEKDLYIYHEGAQKFHWRCSLNGIEKIDTSSDNAIVLASSLQGIWRYDLATKQLAPLYKNLAVNLVQAKQKDSYWMAGNGRIYSYNTTNKLLSEALNLSTEGVYFNDILHDSRNKIWWFASSAGLYKYSYAKPAITGIRLPAHLAAFPVTVTALAAEDSSKVWLGLSHSGVVYWNRTTDHFKLYKTSPNTPCKKIQILGQENLLAIHSDGAYFIENGLVKRIFKPSTELSTGFVDSHDRLWLFQKGKEAVVLQLPSLQTIKPWKQVHHPEFFTQNTFTDVCETEGKIWFSAWFPKGFGIAYYDESQAKFIEISYLNNEKQFIGDYFLSAQKTNENDILFSGYGGLNVVDRFGKIKETIFGNDSSLHFKSPQFYHSYRDTGKNYWVCTSNGLYFIKGNKALRYAESDGLLSNYLSYGFAATQAGTLYIGQKNALNIVDINLLSKAGSQGPLQLSHVKILGSSRAVNLSEPFVFERNENSLSFDFSQLSFGQHFQQSYQYLLEDGWVDNGNKPNISFSGMGPGQHSLQVRVGNQIDQWSTPLQVHFEIKPHFYETWWFKLLLFALLVALAFAFYWQKISQLKRTQHIRARISSDLHDEVGATMSAIGMIGAMFKQQFQNNSKQYKLADRLVTDAKAVAGTLDDIIWSIRPQNDKLLDLSARMKRYAADLFESQNIEYSIHMPDVHLQQNLKMDTRHDLYLIFKEALNNLTKYAQASKAELTLRLDKKEIYLCIKDNGKGFDSNRHTERNGLRNMRERAQKLGGHCHITSSPGAGTCIEVTVPI